MCAIVITFLHGEPQSATKRNVLLALQAISGRKQGGAVCVHACVCVCAQVCTFVCVHVYMRMRVPQVSYKNSHSRATQFLSCGNFGCVCVVCLFYPCVSVQETVNFVSCCFFHSETIIAIDSANISCFFILIFLSKVKN